MSVDVGLCPKCNILREEDEHGPVTPCACFVEHHANDCRLRIAVRSPVSVACDAHGMDSCPACFSCTCAVPADRAFACGRRGGGHLVFAWEVGVGLVLTRREAPEDAPSPPGSEGFP